MQNLTFFSKNSHVLPHQPVYEPNPRENLQKHSIRAKSFREINRFLPQDCENPRFSSQPVLKSQQFRDIFEKKPVFLRKEVTLKPFKREKTQRKPLNSIKKQNSAPNLQFSQCFVRKSEEIRQTSLGKSDSSQIFAENTEKCCKICFERTETRATGENY